MNILIVGAGAVGQVYGRHLAQAGHAITFFVKPAHYAALADGLPLHRLGWIRHRSETWRGYELISDVAAVAARPWDQVWLCVSGDALQAPLTAEVVRAAAGATVVCLQPGPDSAERVRAWLPADDKLVQGLIPFISYQSPLPGRPGPAGIAYFLSPLMPGLFAGERLRVAAVVQALRAGGFPARQVRDLHRAAGGGEAMLNPLVAALEVNGWRLGDFGGSEALQLGRRAALEAVNALAAEQGFVAAPFRLLLSSAGSRLLLLLAPRVLPLALEPYLAYHFGKVGVQTRQLLDSYVEVGSRQGLPVAALRELRSRLS